MLLLASGLGLGHGGCMDFLYSAFRLMYQFQQRMKAWLEYIILHRHRHRGRGFPSIALH